MSAALKDSLEWHIVAMTLCLISICTDSLVWIRGKGTWEPVNSLPKALIDEFEKSSDMEWVVDSRFGVESHSCSNERNGARHVTKEN